MGRYFNSELLGQRLLELMSEFNETTYSLGEYLGLRPSTISRYTTGEIKEPKLPTINAIATKFSVSPMWLMGTESAKKYPEGAKKSKIPVYSDISLDSSMFVQESIKNYEVIDKEIKADFAIRVKGDAMINARILDGDLIYIKKQSDVENGEIAVVIIDNNNEATLKRLYKLNGAVILRAENPNYPDQVFSGKDKKNIRIIGKATYFLSEVR